MHQTYEELQAEYGEILNTAIHVEPEPNPTFLQISGFPHYEDVISNWYAFFFDSNERHALKRLFIETLIEMLNEKLSADNQISGFSCSTIRERSVEGKRIDILLYDEKYIDSGVEKYKNAIIIENKIYAALYNDLKLYYRNISADESKVGVVLSLNSYDDKLPSNYYSITHAKFLERVLDNSGRYFVKANEKYLLLLKDFIQQIQIFNLSDNMKEVVKFYFDNAVKINELYNIKNQAIEAIVNQLKKAIEPTDFRVGRRYPESLNVRYEGNGRVLLLIKTGALFDKSAYDVEVWLSYELAAIWYANETIRNKVFGLNVPEGFIYNKEKSGKQWSLVGTFKKEFSKEFVEIEQLPKNIANHLQLDVKPFLDQILMIIATA